jgi:RNA polymerase sigma factor (sigma-70 family)
MTATMSAVCSIAWQIGVKNEFDTVIRTLRPRDSVIFALYFMDDLSMEKIGQKVGISTTRVHQLLKGRIKETVVELLDGGKRNRA